MINEEQMNKSWERIKNHPTELVDLERLFKTGYMLGYSMGGAEGVVKGGEMVWDLKDEEIKRLKQNLGS